MNMTAEETLTRSRIFVMGTEVGRLAEASRRAHQHESTFRETMDTMAATTDKARLGNLVYDYMHADLYGKNASSMIQESLEALSDRPLAGLSVQDSHMALLTGIQSYIFNAAIDNDGAYSETRHDNMIAKRLDPAIQAAGMRRSGGLSAEQFYSESLSNSAAYSNNIGRTVVVDTDGKLMINAEKVEAAERVATQSQPAAEAPRKPVQAQKVGLDTLSAAVNQSRAAFFADQTGNSKDHANTSLPADTDGHSMCTG